MSTSVLRTIGVVLLVLGIIAVAIGIVYFVVPAHSLPSFLGRLHRQTGHRPKRGLIAVVVGGLLLIGAAIAFVRSRSGSRSYAR